MQMKITKTMKFTNEGDKLKIQRWDIRIVDGREE